MKKDKFKEKLQYWFDTRMSKGSLGLVNILIVSTLVFVCAIGLLLFLADYDTFGLSLFDTISTVINAWMPEAAGEEVVVGHLILKSIAAIFGLLLTSVLIGIIASSIEEKINDLKRGNSVVLESGHLVVLGFTPGEYSLLNQLILAEGEDRSCILVVEDMERDEMEQDIRDNLEYGKNIKIICRKAEIYDAAALEKCSVSRARSVIISPTNDARTVKTLLALSSVIHTEDHVDVKVGAVVTNKKFNFPASEAKKHNITTLHTGDIMARIIAHTCTQAGLSATFNEILSFEGSELYTMQMDDACGLTFLELLCRMDCGTPIGIITGGAVRLSPDPSYRIQKDDQILLLAEDNDVATLIDPPELPDFASLPVKAAESAERKTIAIIGYSKLITPILQGLPDNLNQIIFVGLSAEEKEWVKPALAIKEDTPVSFCDDDLSIDENLRKLCDAVDHIVILSNYRKEEDESDMDIISKILHLRDIRERFHMKFNITAEMRREHNQRLISTEDNTDYIVASNLSSLFLAQFAENPELLSAFRELLSNEGNELYLKSAASMNCTGDQTTAQIRQKVYKQGGIFLGYLKETEKGFTNVVNPALNESIHLDTNDKLIVISEN